MHYKVCIFSIYTLTKTVPSKGLCSINFSKFVHKMGVRGKFYNVLEAMRMELFSFIPANQNQTF